MGDREERVVVGGGAGAAYIGLRVHLHGRSEQDERLVDDMAAQVVQQPADLLRVARLAPAALRLRTPPLETGLEALYVAQLTVRDQAGEGEEVVVPAAVLEDREQQPALLGEGRELPRLGGRTGDRLVHDDRQTGLERGGRDRDVGPVRRGDHDQTERVGAVRTLPQLLRRRGEPYVRELGARLRPSFLVRRDDRVEDEALGRGDQGAWKTEPARP